MSDLNFIIVAQLFNVCCRSEVNMVQNNRDFTTNEYSAAMKHLFALGTQPKNV
jgi:hypothetical protein